MTVDVRSTEAIAAAFDNAGVRGWLHARDIDRGTEVGLGADELVVTASVFKLPVLVELFRQHATGQLDAAEQITVPVEGRAPGPYGLSVLRDPVTLSLRDLAWWMIAVSDNAATDVICERVGLAAVDATMAGLGLTDTRVPYDCRDLFATMVQDAGLDAIDDFPAVPDLTLLARLRVLDPAATNRTTPREITTLLSLIWTDQAAGPEACAEVRRILGDQVWPHRLASGFPQPEVRTSGKTGTLPGLRNEVGVVEYADGGRYAVAVFTRALTPRAFTKDPVTDAAIGRAAGAAVDLLRAGSLTAPLTRVFRR